MKKHENIVITPVFDFKDEVLEDSSLELIDNIYLLRNTSEFQDLLRKSFNKNNVLMSKREWDEFLGYKFFLAKKFNQDEVESLGRIVSDEDRNYVLTKEIKTFIISLRLIIPNSTSGRQCLYITKDNTVGIFNRTYIYLTSKHEDIKINVSVVKDAIDIYIKYIRASKKSPNRLLFATLYFELAQSSYLPWGRFMTVSSAMESLFNTDRYEVTRQISERAAVLLGGDKPEEKIKILEIMKKIYRTRSRIVHGEIPVDNPKQEYELLQTLEDYFRKALRLIFDDEKLFDMYTVKNGKNHDSIREYFNARLVSN